jgi:hypothetical protein
MAIEPRAKGPRREPRERALRVDIVEAFANAFMIAFASRGAREARRASS